MMLLPREVFRRKISAKSLPTLLSARPLAVPNLGFFEDIPTGLAHDSPRKTKALKIADLRPVEARDSPVTLSDQFAPGVMLTSNL